MSKSPTHSQSEVGFESSANIASTPVSDYPNLPLLFKYNDEHNAMISHVDENNENEAV
jgi:hypothetical protein